MTNKNPELLPCQVSDAMLVAGRNEFIKGIGPGDWALGGRLNEILTEIYTAMSTASTIPTDGELVEAVVREIESYGEGLVPELRIVCNWLVNHFRDPDVLAALSIQTISGKGMREALVEARKQIAYLNSTLPVLAVIDAALADQGERG